MLIKRKPGWALPETAATSESVFRQRRSLVKAIGAGSILVVAGPWLAACGEDPMAPMQSARAADDPLADLYPAARNDSIPVDRAIVDESLTGTYNNFYEFGSHKNVWKAAQALPIRPWQVAIDGMVETPLTIDADRLIRTMTLEERVYRHRCVEAWSMTIPWTGFPLAKLVEFAKPLSGARYLVMTSFQNPDLAPGQRQSWYPWPYSDGLTIAEATNALAFIVTGAYGKPMAKQYGAPLRLAVPWKYGFKHVKSITRFHFTDQRPVSFWEKLAANEYGFWANVNPEVAHPRWSQASEEVLGTSQRVPTLLYNGYGDTVAGLYQGMGSEKLFM